MQMHQLLLFTPHCWFYARLLLSFSYHILVSVQCVYNAVYELRSILTFIYLCLFTAMVIDYIVNSNDLYRIRRGWQRPAVLPWTSWLLQRRIEVGISVLHEVGFFPSSFRLHTYTIHCILYILYLNNICLEFGI